MHFELQRVTLLEILSNGILQQTKHLKNWPYKSVRQRRQEVKHLHDVQLEKIFCKGGKAEKR